MTLLFRTECIEHSRQQGLGGIRLTRPLSITLLTAFAVLAAGAVAAFLVVAEYTRKARVAGYLVPDRGVLRLPSPQSASVLESHAAEGLSVRRGDVLYVLSVEQNTPSGSAQVAVQRSIRLRETSLLGSSAQQVQLERERSAALERQVAARQAELGQIDAELLLQRQRLELAEQAVARFESLRGENFVSPAQLQAKREELLAVRVQSQSLQRQRATHERELAELQARQRELPLQLRLQQGELERGRAELAQLSAQSESLRQLVVRAPEDGVLTGVLAQPGQSIAAGATLATLLPADTRLQAQLFAPSSAVGFLRSQQPVLLRYQAFPFQKFGQQGGHVVNVSRVPLQPAELDGAPLPMQDLTEPLYRITVALDAQSVKAYGEPQALVAGMQLDADVLLDRRRLIEWIFAPVLGLANRV